MSNPKNHHYVPQIYLQRFSFNNIGGLFKLIIKSKYPSRAKVVNKSQICYEPYMYKYENSEYLEANELGDPNFIEKNTFKYENSELKELFDKFDYKQEVTKSEYNRILQIIINLKKRNPSLRNEYLKRDRDEEFINSRTEGLKKELMSKGIKEEEAKQILRKAKLKVLEEMKDDNYRKDMYRNSLLAKEEAIINNDQEILNLLIGWDAKIFQTSLDNPFITSDNPGFTMKDFKEVHNTNLNYVDSYNFPLSPKSILCLTKYGYRNDELLNRKITYKTADKDLVLFFNSGTYFNASKIILSSSEDQLNITKLYNKYGAQSGFVPKNK